ncbi:putative acetyltransferase [Erysiphe neolycopersici]|uniref:Putative acetyltransferase n=1 Tax=Erysiphe neolycopersici TaxID=212602 RepID=A0A420HYV5_9PEZI|nr:putative acetyltransferase [Erysiphe neolycopersici]
MEEINDKENYARMLRGELYMAFTPNLIAMRKRCQLACEKFNRGKELSRRQRVKLWRDVINDKSPLPKLQKNEDEDSLLFRDDPIIEAPVIVDYGDNVKLGNGVFINFNCTFLDTCLITIGSRTLVGPNCSFFAASHPLDPFLRNGINGPESGAPITIGEDCWFGGNVIVCPGVTIGRGVTVGAGSVVTKDVPSFCVIAGNPARVIREVVPKAPDPTMPCQKLDYQRDGEKA